MLKSNIFGELERWFSGYKCILFLQKTGVWLPEPVLYGTQWFPAPGIQRPLLDSIHTCMHTCTNPHTDMYIYAQLKIFK